MKKRGIAFLLALAVAFGASFAFWPSDGSRRESTDATADEWMGYFLALAEEGGVYRQYDGKYRATPTADGGYDFGIPGSACFLTVTEITPDEPEYEPGSRYNYSIGSALGDGIRSSGMHITSDDSGDTRSTRYEIEATMSFDEGRELPVFTVLEVYRTSGGEYYAEAAEIGQTFSGGSSGFGSTHSVRSGGETRTVAVSLSAECRMAVGRAAFIWLDEEKTVLAREAYEADTLPDTLTAPTGAALLIVSGEARGDSGEKHTVRAVYGAGEEMAELYVPGMTDGLAARRVMWLDWGA